VDLSKATAAPRQMRIGEHEYAFSPLTLDDLGWLQERLRAKPLEQAIMALNALADQGVKVSDENRTAMFRAASVEGSEVVLFGNQRQTAAMLSSPDMILCQVWLSLRHVHARITTKQVSEIIRQVPDGTDLLGMIWELSGIITKADREGTSKADGEESEGDSDPKAKTSEASTAD
jgi:hypothetical protein